MSQDDDDETDREFSSRFKNLNTVEEWDACWKQNLKKKERKKKDGN